MKTSRVGSIAFLVTVLCSFSFNTRAEMGDIKVTSIAEVEVEVVNNGKKEIKRASPDRALPGAEVIFTNTFKNIGGKSASGIIINNQIPEHTEYKAGSAFGKNCSIIFSVDGGKVFDAAENLKIRGADGKKHTAMPMQYTHIRWHYEGQLLAGRSGEVGFRAEIK